MSLGAGRSLAELNAVYGTNIIDTNNYIGPRLDCFPHNRISPKDLLPVTNDYFKEMNSPGQFTAPYIVTPTIPYTTAALSSLR